MKNVFKKLTISILLIASIDLQASLSKETIKPKGILKNGQYLIDAESRRKSYLIDEKFKSSKKIKYAIFERKIIPRVEFKAERKHPTTWQTAKELRIARLNIRLFDEDEKYYSKPERKQCSVERIERINTAKKVVDLTLKSIKHDELIKKTRDQSVTLNTAVVCLSSVGLVVSVAFIIYNWLKLQKTLQ